jgi:spore coat polysaccharide biosynthesis protein SpsF
MGGSDPAGMTPKVVAWLRSVRGDFKALVVDGPASSHRQTPVDSSRIQVVTNTKSFPTLLASADLAIISFGVTAYELAALGVPAIYLALTEDHAESASRLEAAGCGISLGLFRKTGEAQLKSLVERLLSDDKLRLTMGEKARRTVDGLGARRIADLLALHHARRN